MLIARRSCSSQSISEEKAIPARLLLLWWVLDELDACQALVFSGKINIVEGLTLLDVALQAVIAGLEKLLLVVVGGTCAP